MPSDVESQPKGKAKKRRHIVVSETDSSDEADTPTVKTRRKQRINKLKSDLKKLAKGNVDLEAGSSSQSDKSNEKIANQTEGEKKCHDAETDPNRVEQNPTVLESSKSSRNVSDDKDEAANATTNEEFTRSNGLSGDNCPICFVPFTTQEVGIPAACNHCFCLCCILQWSQNTNTCPVDRQPFNRIEVHDTINSMPTGSLPIETRRLPQDNLSNDDPDSDFEVWTNSDMEWIDAQYDPNFETDNSSDRIDIYEDEIGGNSLMGNDGERDRSDSMRGDDDSDERNFSSREHEGESSATDADSSTMGNNHYPPFDDDSSHHTLEETDEQSILSLISPSSSSSSSASSSSSSSSLVSTPSSHFHDNSDFPNTSHFDNSSNSFSQLPESCYSYSSSPTYDSSSYHISSYEYSE